MSELQVTKWIKDNLYKIKIIENLKRIGKIPMALIFSVVLFYYEIVFRQSTVRGVFSWSTLFMLLFCIFYSGVGYLLCTIFKTEKLRYMAGGILLAVTAIPFLVEYFVYRQFKVFYDLNTMFGGATDALTGFTSDIMALIFCFDGILKICLFVLPTVLYFSVGRKFISADEANVPRRVTVFVSMLMLYVLIRVLLLLQPALLLTYDKEYNYQSAVGNFGLVTGIRIDIRENLFGESGSFEDVTQMPPVLPTPDAGDSDAEGVGADGETDGAVNGEGNSAGTQGTENGEIGDEIPGEGTGETNSDANDDVEKNPEEVDDTRGDSSEGQGDEQNSSVEEKPVVYEPNQMDLKFDNTDTAIAELNTYVASLTPSMQNKYTGLFKGKNLIFISAEAFAAEVIDPELTPTLYRLATKGINFTDYYQPASAGTTGGEYQNLFGMLPTAGGRSFKNTAEHLNYFTMGNQLNRLGYFGMAFHNNDYTYYDRHKTHINLGYSGGYMGYGNGMEAYVSNLWPQSDLEMIDGTLELYIDKQPFNIYYMSVSGHSGYGNNPKSNAMTYKNWAKVEHLPYSDMIKGYLAANLELEYAMEHLVSELEAKGIADDTVICISADHFPYGLDNDAALGDMPYLSELYGYEVENYFQRDHSRWILWCGSLEDEEPIIVDSPTFGLDILPTLSNLFGTEFDSRLMPGRDVFAGTPALVFNMNYDWKTDYGTYYASSDRFEAKDASVTLPENYVKTMKAVVRNKIRYCKGVLETDYFASLFK